jgi:HPt (histidine-containing phosphotransfer) domain-containing protein
MEASRVTPHGLRILIYAPAPNVAPTIANLLEPFGNTVVTASSAADAAARAVREKFDLLITSAADADHLAAAPGMHTPLIAVMLRGDRPPGATDYTLRWPVTADALYPAIDSLCESVGETQASTADLPAAIDALAFGALEKSVGVKALIEILQCYVVTAEQLTNALAQACAEENWDEAARLAQDIVGAAGGLGLAAVTQAARHFAQKTRAGENPHELRNAAQMVVGEHIRARRALTSLYPDVA